MALIPTHALIHVASVLSNTPAMDRGVALGLGGGGENVGLQAQCQALQGWKKPSWGSLMPTQSTDAPALCHVAEVRNGLWESGLGMPERAPSPSASPSIPL